MTASIEYQLEPALTSAEFIDVLIRSTLAERRPIHEPDTIAGMIRQADILYTARSAGQLIGLAREISDFHYCTYLSDLAVDVAFQRRGIGRTLIERTHLAAGTHTTLILLSAPAATTYYPHIGFESHTSCWIKKRE
jgi:ribosomal protein S18 acetylase RimI-like enzyme